MNLKTFISVNAVVWIAIGIAFTLYAPLPMAVFGIPEIPENSQAGMLLYWHIASFARLFGAALLGWGLLLLAIRNIADNTSLNAEVRRGIISALLIGNAIAAFVATVQQFSIWDGAAGWFLIIAFLIFFLGYLFLLVTKTKG